MGKDFIPVKLNGYDLKKVYDKVIFNKTREASKESYFYIKPGFEVVEEIEVGTDGTDETLIRLKDNGFLVVEGTIELKEE